MQEIFAIMKISQHSPGAAESLPVVKLKIPAASHPGAGNPEMPH